MSPEDRRGTNFAQTVEDALPQRRTEITCWSCGTTISSGTYCSSCQRAADRESEEWERKHREAKERFNDRIRGL